MSRRIGFTVSYERVTPDSSEYGEAEDSGTFEEEFDLRAALRECGGSPGQPWRHLGECEPSDSDYRAARWYTFPQYNDGTREFYETGTREARTLHIPARVTPSSRLRIARLIGASVPRGY